MFAVQLFVFNSYSDKIRHPFALVTQPVIKEDTTCLPFLPMDAGRHGGREPANNLPLSIATLMLAAISPWRGDAGIHMRARRQIPRRICHLRLKRCCDLNPVRSFPGGF